VLAAGIVLLIPSNRLQQLAMLASPTASNTATVMTPTPTASPTHTSTHTPTVTPTPTITPVFTKTPMATPDPRVEEALSMMSDAQLAGQMVMTGIYGQMIVPEMCNLIARMEPGGIFYRKGNVIDPRWLESFSEGISECARLAGIEMELFIAIDHEGQYGYSFGSGVTHFPMSMAVAATGNLGLANQVAQAVGRELASTGVNMILGPVADVVTNPANVEISTRSFGSDPTEVAALTAITVQGYLSQDLLPVLKHFPGTGAAMVEKRTSLLYDSSDIDTLSQNHLLPFVAGVSAGAPVVMLSNVTYSKLDSLDRPASLSPILINELLKTEVGFGGIVLMDTRGMEAILDEREITVQDAAVQAIAAGADMVLIDSPYEGWAAQLRLLEAIRNGELPIERVKDAVRRILNVKISNNLEGIEPATTVDWSTNQALAEEVGQLAVTLVRDQAGLIPLPDEWKRVLVVCPSQFLSIPNAIWSSGRVVDRFSYSLPTDGPVPNGYRLDSVSSIASGLDGVVVCTYDAYHLQIQYGDVAQVSMIQDLLDQGIPTIVLAMRSPYDLLTFPSVQSYLATFGTTRGQIAGAIDVLLGVTEAAGSLPVNLTP
jgi:beta-N-acetylhexosaminidase